MRHAVAVGAVVLGLVVSLAGCGSSAVTARAGFGGDGVSQGNFPIGHVYSYEIGSVCSTGTIEITSVRPVYEIGTMQITTWGTRLFTEDAQGNSNVGVAGNPVSEAIPLSDIPGLSKAPFAFTTCPAYNTPDQHRFQQLYVEMRPLTKLASVSQFRVGYRDTHGHTGSYIADFSIALCTAPECPRPPAV